MTRGGAVSNSFTALRPVLSWSASSKINSAMSRAASGRLTFFRFARHSFHCPAR